MQPSPADARVHIDTAALMAEEDTGNESGWKTVSANHDTGDESDLGTGNAYVDIDTEASDVPVCESSDPDKSDVEADGVHATA